MQAMRRPLTVLALLACAVWLYSAVVLNVGFRNVLWERTDEREDQWAGRREEEMKVRRKRPEGEKRGEREAGEANEALRGRESLTNRGDVAGLRHGKWQRTQSDDGLDKVNGSSNVTIDMREMYKTLPFANPDGGPWKQGWRVTPEKGPLRVFVLPHSHCDPGWIKTFDQYFQSSVRNILTSVYNALQKDKRRKFIWAEISYFEWWWTEQNESVRKGMRELIKDKRFEFVTGGWVMPDEANSNLFALETQLDEGHTWLDQVFGVKPEYGWSIDPFGYSPTMAYLLQKRGFKGMLIQRVHYAIKKELALQQNLEFFWRQMWDDAGQHDIFTHMMPFYSYDAPHSCGPDPSICCQFDFARIGGRGWNYGPCPWRKSPIIIDKNNVGERAMLLLDQYRKKSRLYAHNVVLVPLGDDFRYQTAAETERQFENYQRLFDYMNTLDGVHVSFGTLRDYFEAVAQAKNFNPPVLKGSFFTYSDREQDYWSGYFTSRVFDKALDRRLESALSAAEALGASAADLQRPRRELSLFQHHDGVTGTAKNPVVIDYARRMVAAIRETLNWMSGRLKKRGLRSVQEPCWKQQGPTERSMWHNGCSKNDPVAVFNPLDWPRQWCGQTVPALGVALGAACGELHEFGHGADSHSSSSSSSSGSAHDGGGLRIDPKSGLIVSPFREQWLVHKVAKGGAYLFFPGRGGPMAYAGSPVQIDGQTVSYGQAWKRSVVKITEGVYDLVYQVDLKERNQEWVVRFESDIDNRGLFHTDLNGFNFDTHLFREDRPLQAQVYPMPTFACIEDGRTRFTVLSQHAQGVANFGNGQIDVWLDRRLAQDDARGLGQGVTDNVPTQTILRIVIEKDVPAFTTKDAGEFQPTEHCLRQWRELNHPLETFKTDQDANGRGDGSSIVGEKVGWHASLAEQKSLQGGQGYSRATRDSSLDKPSGQPKANLAEKSETAAASPPDSSGTVIPIVIMAFKRADYLKQTMDSIAASDVPANTPIIISHDGHVPEMVEFVETLKASFNIVQMFHPFSCFEHPNSFPGNDPALNVGYKGDTYKNPRSDWATCAKHHWWWMMRHVWKTLEYDAMLFTEEDYVVGPSVQETMQNGLDLCVEDECFGVVLTELRTGRGGKSFEQTSPNWRTIAFQTGPMVLRRGTWNKIWENKAAFCKFDDYNWDWTIVSMQQSGIVPGKVVVPGKPQIRHIGASGMHGKDIVSFTKPLEPFHSKVLEGNAVVRPRSFRRNGGWGHPKDQSHCMEMA